MIADVTVTNTGKMDGDEVVQLYTSNKNSNILKPIKALKAFQRIFLKSGESKTITFQITPEDLSLVNENGKQYQPRGKTVISIGGGQLNVKNITTSNVVSSTINVQ